ncbi:MAG: TiaS agmantine-binding domain-containing protein [Candidatus Heimdallarchaeaceae archaeon]
MQLEGTLLHIGFDDTDSLSGNCTTYLAALIIEQISCVVEFLDYPRLIRNNPNIPWKTRGNGAIALTLKVNSKDIPFVISTATNFIKMHYEEDQNTNPGFVVIKGEIPQEIKEFAKKTLVDVIEINKAKQLVKKYSLSSFYIGNGRGLIGALAALGNLLCPQEEDFTFELLTYRTPEYVGTKRKIVLESVYKMDKRLKPLVFNNIDEDKKNVIIAPAGKDPVLYGIRGEDPQVLLQAMKIVQTEEPIERYCIFRTNQGTDQHFKYANSKVKEYSVFVGEIEVLEHPRTISGGHVFLKGIVIENGQVVDIAAFEPTKSFRHVIKQLCPKDKILAYGGVQFKEDKKLFTIQLEKCKILYLQEQIKEESPFCPQCGKRMTSAGLNKGYKCKKCGFRGREMKKSKINIPRKIELGLYIPPAGAQRHLVKPFRRYNIPRKEDLQIIPNWWNKLI